VLLSRAGCGGLLLHLFPHVRRFKFYGVKFYRFKFAGSSIAGLRFTGSSSTGPSFTSLQVQVLTVLQRGFNLQHAGHWSGTGDVSLQYTHRRSFLGDTSAAVPCRRPSIGPLQETQHRSLAGDPVSVPWEPVSTPQAASPCRGPSSRKTHPKASAAAMGDPPT
jgi:hypothetical protein